MGLNDSDAFLANYTFKAGGPEPPKDPENEPNNKEGRDKNNRKGLKVRNPFKFVGDMFSRENVEQAEVQDGDFQFESGDEVRPLIDKWEESNEAAGDQNPRSIADIFREAFQNENITASRESG